MNAKYQQVWVRNMIGSKQNKDQNDRIAKIYRFGKSLKPFPLKNNVNKHMFCNYFQWEPFQNAMEHRFCDGTDGKRKENICFALEPIRKATKTLALRGNI